MDYIATVSDAYKDSGVVDETAGIDDLEAYQEPSSDYQTLVVNHLVYLDFAVSILIGLVFCQIFSNYMRH